MIEFLNECVQPANLPATVLMILVLLYWVLIIVGVLSAESLDFDLGVDSDVDVDADADIDGSGAVADALTFFHLGEVPVMILASFLIFFFWITTLLSNHYLNPTLSFVVTLYCLIPNLLISLLLTKVAVMPLVPLFRSMNLDEKLELIGRQATVSTSYLDGQFGQVSIEQDGPPIVINAQTETGLRLQKNDLVKIKRFIQETGVYIVEPDKSEKN